MPRVLRCALPRRATPLNSTLNAVPIDPDYEKYRGRCKEFAEDAVKADQTLKLVRGWYICPFWGEEGHWWTVRPDGTIYDPTALQFPSKGTGEYVPFDGVVKCCNCNKSMPESDAWRLEGKYAYCSYRCYGEFVGVI